MKVVIDVEANGLENPDQVWLVVCKDILTGDYHIFRGITYDDQEKQRFLEFCSKVSLWIGHNLLDYDLPVLDKLCGTNLVERHEACIDTLIISKLVDYSREGGHSIAQYGEEFGLEKIKFSDWTKWSQQMEDYCVRDVDICHRIYNKYLSGVISNPDWSSAIGLEHRFQLIVNDLHRNGFSFNSKRANDLLLRVEQDLKELDKAILESFPPREVVLRTFTPKVTKYGTISKTSVPRSLWESIHNYTAGVTYNHTKEVSFNPSSHKQIISVLNEAGWQPVDKTQTHIDTERELNRLKYARTGTKEVDLEALSVKLIQLKKTGWKINETNLSTLSDTAPPSARTLAKRILLESRRRTLTEWLNLVDLTDNRVHGRFYGIGAWTHRMAHQRPNTANIPSPNNLDGSVKLLGKELRSLWCAPKNRLLVGVDAEGIQLRIFAHYIEDAEFTDALIKGKKDDKTDPHSLNQRVLGSICKTRATAKRFVYALLLGAGIGKLAQILESSQSEAQKALDNLLLRYKGFASLKQDIMPRDARLGWFKGLDGRKVAIPGATTSERKHLAMSGYLQNGEAIIVKRAALIADADLFREKKVRDWLFVNIVHDELQSEVKNDMKIALQVAEIINNAIREAGKIYKLKCPMAGSYWNDDKNDYTIGTDWYATH